MVQTPDHAVWRLLYRIGSAAETYTRTTDPRWAALLAYCESLVTRPTDTVLFPSPAGVGFVLFVYGKKQGRWPHMLAGIVFSVYPYFTSSIAALLGVGAVLGTGLWMAVRAGW